MRGEAFGAVLCVCATVVAVKYLDRKTDAVVAAREAPVAASLETPAPSPYSPRYRDEVRIEAGPHNQFYVTAAVNRRASSFLVDTGASFVALRRSDAENSSIYVSNADFTHGVRTANGVAHAARVVVDEIEIQSIRIRNVEAFILPDDKLGTNLLGMSFLSKLDSVETRAGELVLRGQ